ncbi:MAG: phytanoyl-CoA dioxygenase family protein [bacterium]
MPDSETAHQNKADPIPPEFTAAAVASASPPQEQLYTGFLKSGEPYRSMYANNPWLLPPDYKKPLEWGTGRYWDTTVARKHPHWKDIHLPGLTKDIRQMRRDLSKWGYCLIEEGLSQKQYQTLKQRILDQAAGEKLAGVEQLTPSGQYVNTLINKGSSFGLCIEQHPDAVQAGPVIEQLMDETLGKGWICHSFLSNGADPGGYPQGLHLDQGPLLPWITEQAPALVNTMYILEDVNEVNGGTLVIPGSHRIMAAAGSGGTIGSLPPAINLEAPGGTIMVFDGRLLHGTGANRSDQRRFVATMSNVKSWMRTQENWVISVRPEILEQASPKLLHRIGFQALTYGATVEGFGLGARGRIGDRWGNIKGFRSAYDRGAYLRVGELSPSSSVDALHADYTLRQVTQSARQR